jgi:tetratricopeptide (TPR) repeat protein
MGIGMTRASGFRKSRRALFGLLAIMLTTGSAQAHEHHGAEGGNADAAIEKFGTIHMPISCAASVQAPFERGVALLHSFWYEEATKQFKAIAEADSHCAMAYWGLAMAEWRPFWDGINDDRRKAGAAEIDQAALLNPKTDREQRYIAALSGYLHSPEAQKDQALQTYNEAMGALTKAYPDDVEAQAFYGLGLAAVTIGVADPVAPARKALAVLLPGFRAHPDHPGFAHYIIHTCDNPQLAREALPAAEKYAAIAPSSAHALHMPGHIFARLGMWREDIASDKASVKASEFAETHHLGGVGHQMHADEFLLYAYLQQGDDSEAKATLALIEPLVAHLKALPGIEADDMFMFASYFQVELPDIYGLELSDWKTVLAVPEPAQPLVSAKYYRVWAQAIAAGHLRDPEAADAAVAAAHSIYDATEAEGSPISLEIKAAQATIEAWQSFAHHDDAHALQKIGEAADVQDKVGQAEVDIPAREMYGDMLLIDGRPAEALVQYRTALRLSPNRFNGLYHAGRAAETAGKPAEALVFYKQLLKVTNGGAHSHRPEIVYVRDYVQHGGAKGSESQKPRQSASV